MNKIHITGTIIKKEYCEDTKRLYLTIDASEGIVSNTVQIIYNADQNIDDIMQNFNEDNTCEFIGEFKTDMLRHDRKNSTRIFGTAINKITLRRVLKHPELLENSATIHNLSGKIVYMYQETNDLTGNDEWVIGLKVAGLETPVKVTDVTEEYKIGDEITVKRGILAGKSHEIMGDDVYDGEIVQPLEIKINNKKG